MNTQTRELRDTARCPLHAPHATQASGSHRRHAQYCSMWLSTHTHVYWHDHTIYATGPFLLAILCFAISNTLHKMIFNHYKGLHHMDVHCPYKLGWNALLMSAYDLHKGM